MKPRFFTLLGIATAMVLASREAMAVRSQGPYVWSTSRRIWFMASAGFNVDLLAHEGMRFEVARENTRTSFAGSDLVQGLLPLVGGAAAMEFPLMRPLFLGVSGSASVATVTFATAQVLPTGSVVVAQSMESYHLSALASASWGVPWLTFRARLAVGVRAFPLRGIRFDGAAVSTVTATSLAFDLRPELTMSAWITRGISIDLSAHGDVVPPFSTGATLSIAVHSRTFDGIFDR